tara:strand:+ start:1912 stop:2178 length:267 start_codon:yes stop_codon:yes gene_type:complete
VLDQICRCKNTPWLFFVPTPVLSCQSSQVLVFGGYDGTDFFGGHNGEFVMLDYDDQVWDVPADNNPLFLVPSQRAGVVAVAQVFIALC